MSEMSPLLRSGFPSTFPALVESRTTRREVAEAAAAGSLPISADIVPLFRHGFPAARPLLSEGAPRQLVPSAVLARNRLLRLLSAISQKRTYGSFGHFYRVRHFPSARG